MVEFIIAFIPMFVFFLGITQLAFLSAAKLVVQHAATKAVRAAIVAEPLPKRDCPNGDDPNAERAYAEPTELPDPFNKQADANLGDPSTGSPLLTRVRSAAYLSLAALAPPLFVYPVGSAAQNLLGKFAGAQTTRFAAGYFFYNRSHAAITFRDESGADYEPQTFAENEMVRVHVLYLNYCMMPIVSRFMCRPLSELSGFSASELLGSAPKLPALDQVILSNGAALTDYRTQLTALGERASQEAQAAERTYSQLLKVEYPAMLLAWVAPSLRFRVLEAEARLPAQYAAYVDLCQQ